MAPLWEADYSQQDGPGHCWLLHAVGSTSGAQRGAAAAPHLVRVRRRGANGSQCAWLRPGPASGRDWPGEGRGQRVRGSRPCSHWWEPRREPGSGRGRRRRTRRHLGPPGLPRRPLASARLARGLAAMHPTPPGPLGDCLRDWEELQQDFQSIQVSASAGSVTSLARGHWSGRGEQSGQELGTQASFPRAAGPGVPPGLRSRLRVSVRRRHTADPTAPVGPRAFREGLGKRPRPQPRFLTEEWPLESAGRAQCWVRHSADVRWAPPE